MNPLLAALEQRAASKPEELAVRGQHCDLSVAELLARVHEMALELSACNARTVALYADNSAGWIIADLACQFEGICLVPVPTFFSSTQVAHLLRSADVDLIIYDAALAQRLPETDLMGIRRLHGTSGLCMAGVGCRGDARIPPGTDKITFTSGSTGEPKGVCLSFAQCLSVASSLQRATAVERPRHLCVLPLSTLLENIGGVYMPLLAGGSSVTLPCAELGMQGSSGLDARRFLAAIEHHSPNTMILVPQLLAVLDSALEQGWRVPASLRFVAVGGARVAPAIVQRVRQRGLPVYEGYGISECASVVSLNCPEADRMGSSGRLLPHVEIDVCDQELVVKGNTFLGYLNQPDSWGASSVASGDLGSVDEHGFITVTGRRKNVLITSFGRNVSPEWVESELSAGNQFRQVLVCGDGRPACVALVLPENPELKDDQIDAIVDQVNARLPDYARVAHWLRLPEPMTPGNGLLTDNGRPRRDCIAARYERDIEHLYQHQQETLAS